MFFQQIAFKSCREFSKAAMQAAAGVAAPGEQGHLPREEPAGQKGGRAGRSRREDGGGERGQEGAGRGRGGGGKGEEKEGQGGEEAGRGWGGRGGAGPGGCRRVAWAPLAPPCGPLQREDIKGAGFVLDPGNTVSLAPEPR